MVFKLNGLTDEFSAVGNAQFAVLVGSLLMCLSME